MRRGVSALVWNVKVGAEAWRCPIVRMETVLPIEVIEQAIARGQAALSEYESKRVLAEFGVPVVQEELARDAADRTYIVAKFGSELAAVRKRTR